MKQKYKFKHTVLPTVERTYLFLLGFLFSQNIFTVFSYGSTLFNISVLWPIVGVAYICIKRKFHLRKCFAKIPIYAYLFCACLVLSVFISLFYIEGASDLLIETKGMIYFLLSAALPLFLSIPSFCFRRTVFKGLLVGFLSNLFFSFFGYIAFQIFGYSLSLNTLFHNPNYYTPNYSFRSQGLFLEPSHLMAYLLTVFGVMVHWYRKDPAIVTTLFVGSLFMCLTSGSGNSPIFIIVWLIALFFLSKEKIKNIYLRFCRGHERLSKLLLSALIVLVVGFFITLAVLNYQKLVSIWLNFDPFSNENNDRYIHFMAGIDVFLKRPWGTGFNLSGTMIKRMYPDIGTATTHSLLSKYLAELGIQGTICFFLIPATTAYRLMRKKGDHQNIFIVLSLVGAFVAEILNGVDFPIMHFSLGLAFCEGYDAVFRTKIKQFTKYGKNGK